MVQLVYQVSDAGSQQSGKQWPACRIAAKPCPTAENGSAAAGCHSYHQYLCSSTLVNCRVTGEPYGLGLLVVMQLTTSRCIKLMRATQCRQDSSFVLHLSQPGSTAGIIQLGNLSHHAMYRRE